VSTALVAGQPRRHRIRRELTKLGPSARHEASATPRPAGCSSCSRRCSPWAADRLVRATARSRTRARRPRQRAQRLLVEAGVDLFGAGRADNHRAQAFLAGGLEPPDADRSLRARPGPGTTALTPPRGVPPDAATRRRGRRVLLRGGQLRAVVATARCRQPQGLRSAPLPRRGLPAQTATRCCRRRRSCSGSRSARSTAAYSSARSTWWLLLLTLLLLVTLLALVLAQGYLSRATHRTFKPAVLGRHRLIVLLALAPAPADQPESAPAPRRDTGSTAAAIAEARISPARARPTRRWPAAHAAAAPTRPTSLRRRSRSPLTRPLSGEYLAGEAITAHKRISTCTGSPRWTRRRLRQAVKPLSARHDENVSTRHGRHEAALDQRKAVFTSEIDSAGQGWALRLIVVGPLLALIACALVAAASPPVGST